MKSPASEAGLINELYSRYLKLGRQIAVDLKADANFDELRGESPRQKKARG